MEQVEGNLLIFTSIEFKNLINVTEYICITNEATLIANKLTIINSCLILFKNTSAELMKLKTIKKHLVLKEQSKLITPNLYIIQGELGIWGNMIFEADRLTNIVKGLQIDGEILTDGNIDFCHPNKHKSENHPMTFLNLLKYNDVFSQGLIDITNSVNDSIKNGAKS